MTDVRPQAMALQNSITLDKKFGIEISIFLHTGQTRPDALLAMSNTDCSYCATKGLLKIIQLAICQFSIFVWRKSADLQSACQYDISTEGACWITLLFTSVLFCTNIILLPSTLHPPASQQHPLLVSCTLHYSSVL